MQPTESLLSKLKPFLVQKLSPICDADPEVLSEYVLALLKHDLSTEQLKEKCRSQLSDFLREHTNSFVEDLFAFLVPKPAPSEQQQQPVSYSMDEESGEESPDSTRKSTLSVHASEFIPSKDRPQRICRNFSKSGSCHLGDRCRFAHISPQTSGSRFVTSKTPLTDDPEARRLVIDKIPSECCNQNSVFHYFKRFGFIINIELEPEFKRASVLFGEHEEAVRAFQSPDSMFGNRFVKIFWDANQKISPDLKKETESHSKITTAKQPKPPVGSGKREFLLEQQKSIMEKLKEKEITDAEREQLFQSLETISNTLSRPTVVHSAPRSFAQPAYSKPFAPTKRNISQTFSGDSSEPVRKKSMSVDFRPKTIVLSGIVGEGTTEIMHELKEWSPTSQQQIENNSLEISFAERYQAEAALNYLLSTHSNDEFQVGWKATQ